tara:strand:+ start:6398 stop:9565 length:3168 start_codon:yes stop_codon:yes gene_type:complete
MSNEVTVTDIKSVQDYRDLFGDEADILTDQEITEGMFEDYQNDDSIRGQKLDFYTFSNAFNKNSPFKNIEKYKEIYGEDNPEILKLDNLGVSDLAFKTLEKYGSKIKFTDFVERFAPRKITGKEYVPYGIGIGDFMPTLSETKPYTTFEIAKKFNVETDTPQDKVTKARFGLDIASSEQQGLEFAKRALTKKFDQDITIRRGPRTDAIEFYDPKRKKYTLLNKPGLDMNDFVTLGDDAFVIVSDIAAQIVGGVAGLPAGGAGFVAGSSLASGFAVPFATYLEDAFGEYVTNPKNISWSKALEIAKKRNPETFSFLSATLTGLGLKAGDFFKWVGSKQKGKKLTNSELSKMLVNKENTEEALKLLANIRKREAELGLKSKTNFTIAEMSDDVDLLAKQVAYEKNPFYGMRGQFDTFNKQRADALNAYFNAARKRFSNKSVMGNDFESQKAFDDLLQDIFRQRQDKRFKEAFNIQKKAEKDLTNQTIKLSDGSYKDAGQTISNGIEEVYKSINKDFNKNYKKLYALRIGGQKAMDRKVGKDEIEKVYKEFLKKKKESQVEIDDIPFKNPKDLDGYTLSELKTTMTELLKIDRAKFTGKIYPEGFPGKFIKAIDAQLKKDLSPDDPWLTDYLKLSDDYGAFKKRFNGIAEKLLTIKDGKLKIQNEDVFETYFKKGLGQDTRVKQVVDILQESPKKLKSFRDSTENFYLNYITKPDGSFDLSKHQKFMKDYGRSLKIVFPDAKKFTDTGDAIAAFNKSKMSYEKTLKDLEKTTEGKLLSSEPGDILNIIYKKDNPATLERVVNIIKDKPRTLNALKTRVIDDIYNSSVKTGKINNFDSLKFIEQFKRNQQKLKIIFKDDPIFMQDLNNFTRALEVMNRRVAVAADKDGIPQFIISVLRTNVAPPLSKRGRALTAVQTTMENVMGQRIAKTLMDPDALKTFTKFLNLQNKINANPKSPSNLRIIASDKYKKLRNSVFPQYFFKGYMFDEYPQEQTDKLRQEEILNINLPKTSSNNLSSAPIDVATLQDKPQQQRPAANTPTTDKQNTLQGLASLGLNFFS